MVVDTSGILLSMFKVHGGGPVSAPGNESLLQARCDALAAALREALSEFDRLAAAYDHEGMSYNSNVAGALRRVRFEMHDPEQVLEVADEQYAEACGQAMEP